MVIERAKIIDPARRVILAAAQVATQPHTGENDGTASVMNVKASAGSSDERFEGLGHKQNILLSRPLSVRWCAVLSDRNSDGLR